MKKLFIAVIAITLTVPAFAQQKFGHIDSAALLELMPESNMPMGLLSIKKARHIDGLKDG